MENRFALPKNSDEEDREETNVSLLLTVTTSVVELFALVRGRIEVERRQESATGTRFRWKLTFVGSSRLTDDDETERDEQRNPQVRRHDQRAAIHNGDGDEEENDFLSFRRQK